MVIYKSIIPHSINTVGGKGGKVELLGNFTESFLSSVCVVRGFASALDQVHKLIMAE